MKKYIILAFLFFSILASGQGFPDVPWLETTQSKASKTSSYEELIRRFKEYLSQVDLSKKGNGVKPFERWRSLWEPYFYRKGGFHPVKDIDLAFAKKMAISNKSLAESTWTSIGPSIVDRNNHLPGKGRVNYVLIDPVDSNIMYVGAPAGGIWKTTDKGQTWSPLTDDLPQIGVSAIALSPQDHNIIYIGTGDDDAKDTYSRGVFKSTDGGETWNAIGPDLGSDSEVIYELLIHPQNENIIWVASSSGLYKTSDGGSNWAKVLDGNIRSMKRHLNNPDILYAASSSSFYRSTDGGNNFTRVDINFSINNSSFVPQRIEIEVTPAATDNVYLAAAKSDGGFGGIYISNDTGSTFARTAEEDNFFENSRQTWYNFAFTVSDSNPDIMFVGVINISKSTDGGNNFEKLNAWNEYTPNYTHADIHFLRYYNGVLAAGTDGGIYLSEDNGDTFTGYNEDLIIGQFYRISTSLTDNYQIYGGLQDNGGFSRKDMVWRIYHGGDGMENAMHNNQPLTGYSFIYYGESLSITTDGGITVSSGAEQPSGETGNWITPLDMGADGTLYSGFKKVYRLNNGVWEAVTTDAFSSNIDVMECDPLDPDVIYVGEGNKIYKSTDKGKSFVEIGSSFKEISSITVNPFDNKIWFAADNWIYESSDGGNNWDVITGNFPGEHINVIKWHPFSSNNSLYLGTDLGVYYRDDINTDWQVFSTGLPNVPVRDLEINFEQGILTAATFGRGVWECNIPQTKPANDLSIIEIVSVSGNPYLCDANENFIIRVKNKGNNPVNGFEVEYKINGTVSNLNYDQEIAVDETVDLEIGLNNGTMDKYEIEAQVLFDEDDFIQNNNFGTFFLLNQKDNLSYENDFNSLFTGALLHYRNIGDDVWEKAVPSGGVLGSEIDNTQAYCTNAGGEYDNLSKDFLVTPCFDMTQIVNPEISFKLAFDIEEDWDAFYVQYSTDSGRTWEVLGSAQDPGWYNSDTVQSECIGSQWTGTNTTFTTYSHDLSFLANETQVMFRFVMASDELVTGEGVILDDLKISGTSGIANENLTQKIMLYPNPAKDKLYIKWTEDLKLEEVEILALDGKSLYFQKNEAMNTTVLNTANLPAGIYLVKFKTNQGTGIKKLIIR